MGIEIILLISFYIFIYGIFRLLQEIYLKKNYILYIIVKNQEEQIEGYLRYIFTHLNKAFAPYTIVVLVEHSKDETSEIVGRLARKMSFIVREINDFDEWLIQIRKDGEKRIYIWDIRNVKKIDELNNISKTRLKPRA